jgi:hypothetical protein
LSEAKTSEELVWLLQEGDDELFELIGGLDESQLDEAGAQGFRSVKDILAHITHWNQHGIKWIESIYLGEKPVLPVGGDSQEAIREEMAVLNAKVHRVNRDRPVGEVVEEYREVFGLLLDQVGRLEEGHLESVFDYPWASGPVSGRTVVMWRYWHQQNHTKYIQEWINKQ